MGTRAARPGWCAELADLIWPATCPGCGATGAGAAPACPGCLAAFSTPAYRTVPIPRPACLPAVWAVADYQGSAREVLVAYKEHGRRRLAGPLGAALAAGLSAALEAAGGLPPACAASCVVVPMPSSAAARRSRGDDPTRRLASAAVRRLRAGGVPAQLLPALRQLPGVVDQAGLSAEARLRNLTGMLQVRPAAMPPLRAAAAVLLADDIVTTGATLAEATRVLQAGNCAVTGAAVVAATRRRAAP